MISSKLYDRLDDFNFEIVHFPLLEGDFPRTPSLVYTFLQRIRFARVCYNVNDVNKRNTFLTSKLLNQGYRYNKLHKAFSKFYYRHSELIVNHNIGFKNSSATRHIRICILW